MAATVSVSLSGNISVVETLTGAEPGNQTVMFAFTNNEVLSALTTVPAAKFAKGTKALVAGAATLDLTALPGTTADETVNATGLRLQIAAFKGAAANANPINIVSGAVAGHTGLGATFKTIVKAGQWSIFFGDDAGVDIAVGDKALDLSGVGTQSLEYLLVFG